MAWTIVSKDEHVLPWSPERTSKSFQPGQDQPFSVKGDFLVVRLGTPWLCVSSWYEVLLAGTDPRIVRFFLDEWCHWFFVRCRFHARCLRVRSGGLREVPMQWGR